MRWGCGDCGCSERTGAAVARRNAASTPCNRARTPSCARSDHFWKIPVSNRSSRPQNRQFGPRRAGRDHFYVFSSREGSFRTISFVRFAFSAGWRRAGRAGCVWRGLAAPGMSQMRVDGTRDELSACDASHARHAQAPDASHHARASALARSSRYASPMICMANSATLSPPTMATVAHSTMRRGSLAR